MLIAAGFVIAAVIAAAVRGDGWWLPLHLFLVGGVLSAISATTQMLAITWSSSPPTRPWVATVVRWTLAAGAVGVVVGRDTGRRWLIEFGGGFVAIALVGMVPVLWAVHRGAVTDRYRPAIEAYVAAHLFGAVGVIVGVVMATGRSGSRHLELRGTHLIVNLFGCVGLVIAATLPYFTATQVRSKMSPRATRPVLRIVAAVFAAAVLFAALGRMIDSAPLTVVGLAVLAAVLVVIVALLPIFDRKRWSWAGPRLAQLLCGIGWWVGTTIALAVAIGRGTDDRTALRTLAIGGFAQILIASLAYLGPVLRGGGHKQLTAGFAITRSWVSLIAGNVAALAVASHAGWLLRAALIAWGVDLAGRAVWLLSSRSAATTE